MRKPLPHCLTALCTVLLSLSISAQTTSFASPLKGDYFVGNTARENINVK
jgi:hypothetical protein